jgi:hypothetical protein
MYRASEAPVGTVGSRFILQLQYWMAVQRTNFGYTFGYRRQFALISASYAKLEVGMGSHSGMVGLGSDEWSRINVYARIQKESGEPSSYRVTILRNPRSKFYRSFASMMNWSNAWARWNLMRSLGDHVPPSKTAMNRLTSENRIFTSMRWPNINSQELINGFAKKVSPCQTS